MKTETKAYYPNFTLMGDLNLDFDNPRTDWNRIETQIKKCRVWIKYLIRNYLMMALRGSILALRGSILALRDSILLLICRI